jgi:predicted MPP superfamily phosphohydrolase
MPIAHLPDALIGKKLVQISDLHVGPIVDSDFLIDAMRRVSSLEPDLLVITGDFMTYTHAEEYDEVERVLKHLQPAPLGCAGIFGNHEYGWHWQQVSVANQLERRLTNLGIRVLRNRSHNFAGLNIIGLDDYWAPTFGPNKILSQIDRNQANLVLCHNPDVVDQPIWSGYQGWILAGHTHGGQVRPPFLPPPILPVANKRYTAGAFDLWDGRWLYINPGLGYSRRIRFNARPEITVFHLTAAA